MSRFDPYLGRFDVFSNQERDGQLLLSGAGPAGEGPTGIPWAQQHGFASRPPRGSLGYRQALYGRHSQLVVFGGENPKMRPVLDQGGAALYNHLGHIVKVIDAGLVVDIDDQTIDVTARQYKARFTGDHCHIEVADGYNLYLGGEPGSHAFGRVQTDAGVSVNVWARIS